MKKSEFLKLINNGFERGAKRKLAKILNIDPANATMWFSGKSLPSEQNIQKMSGLFSIDEQELRDMFNGKYEEETVYPMPKTDEFMRSVQAIPLTKTNTIQLPILADVPAGLPEYSDRDVEMFVDIPRFLFPGADFIVKCIGDSLEPKIHKGDFCVIRKMTDPIDGRAMLVKSESGVCMKVIKKIKDSIMPQLCSTNPKYKPFTPKELSIIGLIIGHWSRDDKEHWG